MANPRYIVVVDSVPMYTTKTLQKAADACHWDRLKEGVEHYIFDTKDRIYYDVTWDKTANGMVLCAS